MFGDDDEADLFANINKKAPAPAPAAAAPAPAADLGSSDPLTTSGSRQSSKIASLQAGLNLNPEKMLPGANSVSKIKELQSPEEAEKEALFESVDDSLTKPSGSFLPEIVCIVHN